MADTQHFLVVNQGNSEQTHIDLLACDNKTHNTHTIITPSFTTEPAASSFVNFTRSVCVLYPIANSEYLFAMQEEFYLGIWKNSFNTLWHSLYVPAPHVPDIRNMCYPSDSHTCHVRTIYTYMHFVVGVAVACRKTGHSAPARPPQLSMKIKLYVESTKV